MSDVSANTPSSGTGSAPSAPSSTPSTSSSAPNSLSVSDFRNRNRQARSQPEPESVETEVETSAPEESETVDSSVEGTEIEEVEETETEEVEEDLSWLQELKGFKQLHGLELKDIVQAISEGRLPDELLGVLKTKLKHGEEEWEDTFEGVRKNQMRHRDYTQKLQAFARDRDEYNTDKTEFIDMLQSWKGNPDALLSGLERLEFPVLDAAKLLAKRHQELASMTPRERELFEQKAALERELNKNKFDQKRQAQTKSQEQVKLDADKRADFVSNTAKTLFDKVKIPLNDRTWNSFLGKFQIISNSYPPGTAWTAEMIEHAVDATEYDYKEALGRRDSLQQNANPPKPVQKFESPAREQVAKLKQAVPAAKPGKKGGAMTSSDFRKLIGKR